MSRAVELIALAVPFVWFGMVLAISFLEAPLKFRAPGVTLGLGLGIGRLVFRGLNGAEAILTLLLVAAGLVGGMPTIAWVLLAALVALLALQVAVLRPRLDRRAVAIINGDTPPPSRQHLLYVALEAVKVLVLPTLGVILATSVT